MADAKQVGEGHFLVKGTARELPDGRVYVVTENGYLEEMREVVRCRDCFMTLESTITDKEFCVLNQRLVGHDGFCAWGERLN